MRQNFIIKEINAIETQLDKFISTLDAKKSKPEQNEADITSDSDNAEDELEAVNLCLNFCER